jgi:hypothetical protein
MYFFSALYEPQRLEYIILPLKSHGRRLTMAVALGISNIY